MKRIPGSTSSTYGPQVVDSDRGGGAVADLYPYPLRWPTNDRRTLPHTDSPSTSMLTIAFRSRCCRCLRPGGSRATALPNRIIGLILAAGLATAEECMVAPLAMVVVLMAYRRQLLRWAPVAVIALIPIIHFASPGFSGSGEEYPRGIEWF